MNKLPGGYYGGGQSAQVAPGQAATLAETVEARRFSEMAWLNPGAKTGSLTQRILELLESLGRPATSIEVAEKTGASRGAVSGTLSHLRKIGAVTVASRIPCHGRGKNQNLWERA